MANSLAGESKPGRAAQPERSRRSQQRPRGHVSEGRRKAKLRHTLVGLAFIAPFALIFLIFLVTPILYSLGLSLFQRGLATGVTFSGIGNYVKAFTDPVFLEGTWFVVRFCAVLIPIQMAVSLVAALLLDSLTTRLAAFSRLLIFVPYAIPGVIGALMWGFLYSPQFGPLVDVFNLFGQAAPFLLDPQNVFGGLVNIVTWQWAGYYMIIIYAALQGIDPSIYEAAKIDGANASQIALRIKIPMVSSALILILVFALIGTLQFFTEPQILLPLSNGSIDPAFTPNMYAYSLAFSYSQFNYSATISFALSVVVFIGASLFLFFTRKRGGLFS